MTKDLSKYTFDADNPKDFKAYGLLKKIFKDQNILLVIDLFFFNEIFKDIIWTEDVVEEIWDKPDNFEELSSNEKMEVYIDRFSDSEYHEMLEKKRKSFYQTNFLKSVKYYIDKITDKGVSYYMVRGIDLGYKEYQLSVIDTSNEKMIKFSNKVMLPTLDYNLIQESLFMYKEVRVTSENTSNKIFITSRYGDAYRFQFFQNTKSSVLITLEELIKERKKLKLPKNTHPILLKKPEDIHQLLQKVMYDAKVTRQRSKNDVPKAYLKKVEIKNYYTIKDITLNKIYNKKEIYILGENGDGKTLLLQAILMAAKWQQIQNSDLEITGIIHEQIKENKNLGLSAEDTNKQKYHQSQSKSYLENIFAYGASRQDNNAETDEYGYMTLFKKDTYLREPTSWLKYLYTKDLERKANGENVENFLNLDKAKKLLNDLLEEKVTITVTADKVQFTERGSENVKFEQLSDGYKSILIWVSDLVSRLSTNQPKVTDTRDFHGVVLVDEIGLHLHPKWEANLVRKLRNWFPKIQFIFTTHSPIIILNASENAVVYRLYKEEGVTKMSDQYQCSELSDLMLNGLITSPLFDVESASMRFAQQEDLSDDFRLGRLRKAVDKEYQELKKSGKTYISPIAIDDIIKKVMAEN